MTSQEPAPAGELAALSAASVRKRMLSDIVALQLGVGISGALLYGQRILLARALGPDRYAWIALFVIVVTYALYLQLGTISGLYRDVPYFNGSGDHERARRIVDAASLYITSLVGTVLVLSLLLVFTPLSGLRYWNLLPLVGVLFSVTLVVEFMRSYMRAYARFKFLVKFNILLTGLSLVLAVAGATWFGISGAVVGMILGALPAAACFLVWTDFRYRPRNGKSELSGLIRRGSVLMGVGAVNELLFGMDQLFVAWSRPSRDLGLYNVGYTLANAATVWVGVVSQVLFPLLSTRFGESDGDEFEVYRLVRKWLLLSLNTFPVLIALTMAVGGPAVRWILPEYEGTAEVLSMLVIGLSLAGLAVVVGSFALVTGRSKELITVSIAAAAANALVLAVAVGAGSGLVGLGVASSIGSAVYLVLVIVVTLRSVCPGIRARGVLVGWVGLAVGYGVGLGSLANRLGLAPRVVVLAIGCAPFAVNLLRHLVRNVRGPVVEAAA